MGSIFSSPFDMTPTPSAALTGHRGRRQDAFQDPAKNVFFLPLAVTAAPAIPERYFSARAGSTAHTPSGALPHVEDASDPSTTPSGEQPRVRGGSSHGRGVLPRFRPKTKWFTKVLKTAGALRRSIWRAQNEDLRSSCSNQRRGSW